MKRKLFAVLVIFLFSQIFFLSCDSSTDPPPEEKPPGYQENVPWASLANSPWPMYHHDPQNTGRSKYLGPQLGESTVIIDSLYVSSGISIGADSVFYFMSAYENHMGLYACYPDGKLKWKISEVNDEIVLGWTVPLIASDGTIYFTTKGNLVAVNPKGEILWTYQTDNKIEQSMISIGLDGTIYLVTWSATLYAISNQGELKWTLSDSRFKYSGWTTGLSFSPDGNTIYIPGLSPSLFAVDINKKEIKWTFGNSVFNGSPLVDSEGHIYIQSKVNDMNDNKPALYCLNPDGTVRWAYVHNNPLIGNFDETYADGTMDKDGNYYFACDTVYSVDYNGNLRWKQPLTSITAISLVSDNADNLYVILDLEYKALSISKDGTINWTSQIPDRVGGLGIPSIGADRQIYLPTYKSSQIVLIK